MTQAIKKKLRSNEGASLMVALLFFVMCATVGSIILAAATASSGRLANLRKEDQSYYAIASAADLFAETMENKKVMIQLNQTDGTITPKPADLVVLDPKDGKTSLTASNYLLPSLVLDTNLYAILRYGDKFPNYSEGSISDFSAVKTTKITVAGEPGLDVDATISMNKALDLKVVFTSTGSSGSVTMKFKPVVEMEETVTNYDMVEQDDKRNIVHTKTYTISWIDPVTE